MGACCCKMPLPELPALSKEEFDELKRKGHLPCIGGPSVDFKGDNQLQTVYVAHYENGTELTFLFLDEDRPNMCEDCLYDTIRRPLFGRYSDIETVIIVNEQVEFPGTYSADQDWKAKMPEHNEAKVPLANFERRKKGENDETEEDKAVGEGGAGDMKSVMTTATTSTKIHSNKKALDPFVLWVNTWNHLLGDKNTNPNMEITFQYAQPFGGVESMTNKNFVLRKGSRDDVDNRFHGCLTSISTVMTEERAQALGKRLF